MHNAPAVRHPVRRSGNVLAALGLVAALGWLIDFAVLRELLTRAAAPSIAGVSLLALAPLCATWLAFASWRRCAEGELRWDGDQWFFGGAAQEEVVGRAHVLLDIEFALLVSFDVPGRAGRRWLWLERFASPDSWGLLRAAVYSRAKHDTLAPDAAAASRAAP